LWEKDHAHLCFLFNFCTNITIAGTPKARKSKNGIANHPIIFITHHPIICVLRLCAKLNSQLEYAHFCYILQRLPQSDYAIYLFYPDASLDYKHYKCIGRLAVER
jgi:hypothetical protein